MTLLKMPVLENAGTANAGTGKCRYWKMPVLENAGTGKCRYWKLPVLEIASTGKCRYWKLAILENASIGVLPFNILVGCELVYYGNKL